MNNVITLLQRYRVILKKTFVVMISLSVCACTTLPLKGHWINNSEQGRVGLIIKDEKYCELYVERSTRPASTKLCQYDHSEDTYFIYLVKSDGQCGVNADFEFTYDAKQDNIGLMIGGNTVILTKHTP